MKPTIFASHLFAIVLAFQLSGCGASNTADTAVASTPRNEVDVMIDEYEKASNECLRMSKRHTTGDVSVTVLLIVARKTAQQEQAKLQQAAARMSAAQAQRVAAITAKSAPCLGP
ncbi:MAG: hypothetical protein H0W66_01565 [Chthoniobacterales bacterium]|nr:hypothetical protein [Chthoniobacterales bacterium]